MPLDLIEQWLSRETPVRGVNDSLDLSIVLATDTGLTRTENQDKAASLIACPTPETRVAVIAVADGMGGMVDGKKCASIALSSFFSYILNQHHSQNLKTLIEGAAHYANNKVFELHKGNGGSTLAAITISSTGEIALAHLGDSRIYSTQQNERVSRLTIDDSLEEAVGGHGRELLQYVGMGAGCKPHINEAPPNVSKLIITTDGIHFLEQSVLFGIFKNCDHNKALADRLVALARWVGSPDNATTAIIDVAAVRNMLARHTAHETKIATLSDPFSSLYIPFSQKLTTTSSAPSDQIQQPSTSQAEERPATSAKAKKPRKRKKIPAQLEISVEPLTNTNDNGDDSK